VVEIEKPAIVAKELDTSQVCWLNPIADTAVFDHTRCEPGSNKTT
jgi:hypothetical protein